MSDDGSWPVRFTPFASAVDSPFWVQYCREKLENIKLNEEPIPIRASFGLDDTVPRLQCQESSLRPGAAFPNERVAMEGSLIGFNTLETFQKADKNKLLLDHFLSKFLQGDVACFTSFTLLTFPDLKSHKVVYWFGVPALLTARDAQPVHAVGEEKLADAFGTDKCRALRSGLHALRCSKLDESGSARGLSPFFLFDSNADRCVDLRPDYKEALGARNVDDVIFGFYDPSGASTASGGDRQPMAWPMRNLVAYLCFHCDLGGSIVKILSYRPTRVRRIDPQEKYVGHDSQDDNSILLRVRIPKKSDYDWSSSSKDGSGPVYKVVGWELNARNKPGPRSVNLRPLLDSKHLAIQAADLNLKLMKWRQIPSLEVEKLQSTKVLLIGAGTLGCNVARTLLGWGVRNMKIVDYGNVSYSNPVRQSLFTLQDCEGEKGNGLPKAAAASDALKAIAADVQSEGIVLSIPMPGHVESKETIEKSVLALDALVKECDVVYLLTDTRESRWLPTVMAAAHNKTLINAALGLDSWLVMRHGGGVDTPSRLGCYFCNDVVAPENSMKNRTLDQQCTVTRPGLAPIASSMAVELMVAMMHHPDGHGAPAPVANISSSYSPTTNAESASALGVMPHQIRGSLVSYTMMTPTVPAFPSCTGCCAPVVEAYKADKVGLMQKVCESQDSVFLETLSGLTAFRAEATAKLADMEDWDDDEDESDM